MHTIVYKFVDGTKSIVEVSDEFYALYLEVEREERNAEKRETRRHVSLDYLNSFGIDFADPDGDALDNLLKNFADERLKKAIEMLLPVQIELIKLVFVDRVPMKIIAEHEGVCNSAISNRLNRIYEKLRKLLE